MLQDFKYGVTKLPDCSECKKSVAGNVYFVRGKVVLCYRCEGRRRKQKRKKGL